MSPDIQRPSIDHTILSPSGRASKRARKTAMDRETARLFPPGFWDPPARSEAELKLEKAETLRRSAVNLRDLATRGVSARKYPREAAKLEAQAERLEAEAKEALACPSLARPAA